jgi:hypothetical protein
MDYSLNAVPGLKAELKARKRRAEQGPQDYGQFASTAGLLPKVWVMYVYSGPRRGWVLAGFARYPHMSKRRIERMRRRFGIDPRKVVEVMDLWLAAKSGGPQKAPAQGPQTVGEVFVSPKTPYLQPRNERTVRRTANPELPVRMDKKTLKARFIVLGELADKRHFPHPTYLGLLFSETLSAAREEAKKLFKSLYTRLHVFSLSELSKSLRRRIRKGRIHAGVTVIEGLVNA